MSKPAHPRDPVAAERKRARKVAKAMKHSLRKRGRRAVDVHDDDQRSFEKLRAGRLQQQAQAMEGGAEELALPKARGLVVSVSRKGCTVRDSDGAETRLWFHNQVASAAVGDWVGYDPALSPDRALACVEPRRTRLSRPDPFEPDLERVIAANVDVAVIVVAPHDGDVRTGVIDRLLIAVERGGVTPWIVLNKSDLVEDHPLVERRLAPYRDLGVRCCLCVATAGEGVDPLREGLAGSTCVFVGHSGVGKSSLINALWPDAERETAGVRAKDGRGRHTTTASRLVRLGDDTRLIDTPGIRSFGLWNIDERELASWFRDFDPHAAACRFRDCKHDAEPDCAVRDAAQAGALAPSRYGAYLRILASLRGHQEEP